MIPCAEKMFIQIYPESAWFWDSWEMAILVLFSLQRKHMAQI